MNKCMTCGRDMTAEPGKCMVCSNAAPSSCTVDSIVRQIDRILCGNLTPVNKLSAINRLTDRYWSNREIYNEEKR